MKTPLIMWEKWVDPFGKDTEESKWTDYENNLEFFREENLEDEEEHDEESKPLIKIPADPVKVIASPLGLIPYNEHTASSKIFNFWLGHTNFNISAKIKRLIENIDGIEILDIFTRYRFRIAIGKCFDDAEVMTTINKQINNLYDKI
jgi:hypothetical protein